jgi:formylglycine-generating enzyme required for sulfatase activity
MLKGPTKILLQTKCGRRCSMRKWCSLALLLVLLFLSATACANQEKVAEDAAGQVADATVHRAEDEQEKTVAAPDAGTEAVDAPATPEDPITPQVTLEHRKVDRNSDGMTMVLIPSGEFLMGDDQGAHPHERPEHTIFLDDYWMDLTEVTNAQFRLCMSAEACSEPEAWKDNDHSRDNEPVIVNWDGANSYCQWAGGRLPSEAEWEKAARGTDGRIWSWGDEFVGDRANLSGQTDGYAFTAPVGSFPEDVSPYGLLDVTGNAAEWVADWYGDEYYAHSPDANPPGPPVGQQRIHRSPISNAGGGPQQSRTTARFPSSPFWVFGFRCASSAEPSRVVEETLPATDGATEPTSETPSVSGVKAPDEPAAGPSGSLIVNPEEELDSFRRRSTSRTQMEDGTWSPDTRMELTWTKMPQPASHMVTFDGPGDISLEIITIGKTQWTKMDQIWVMSEIEDSAPGQVVASDWQAIMLQAQADIEGGTDLLGEETVNGVRCRKFTVDTDVAVPFPVPEDVDEGAMGMLPTEILVHQVGDMWVADDPGLPPVVIRFRTEGAMTTQTPAGDRTMIVAQEVDLLDINEPVTIEPPPAEDTGSAAVGYPMMADAELEMASDMMTVYSTAGSSVEVIAFYETEMAMAGWVQVKETDQMEGMSIMQFSRGDQSVEVTIQTLEPGRTQVSLMHIA